MKNYLIRHLPLLKMLTAISFLLVYVPGEKIGAFLIMTLPISPVFILTGVAAPGILFPNLNPLLSIPMDLLILCFTFFSIYSLIWRRKYGNIDRSINRQHLFNILVFYLWVIKSVINPYNNAFSVATVLFFIVISLITISTVVTMLARVSK